MKAVQLGLHGHSFVRRLAIAVTMLSLLTAFDLWYALASGPRPVIHEITPGNVVAGGPGVRVVVSGSGFLPASIVRWNGANRPTLFDPQMGQLTAAIPDSDLRTPGIAHIIVINPDGFSSGPMTFTIIKGAASVGVGKSGSDTDFRVPNPLPALSSIGPEVLSQGARQIRLTLVGVNFQVGARVVISPSLTDAAASRADRMADDIAVDLVTRVSDKIIVAVVSVKSTATIGVRAVDVVNPDQFSTAITRTSQPLYLTSRTSLATPLDVQTIVVEYPRNGTLVSQGDDLFGEAILGGAGSGTITGQWVWDGNVAEQFVVRMTGGERVSLRTARPLPTLYLGLHNLDLRITSPNLLRSRVVQVVVNPAGTWRLMRLNVPASSAGFAPKAPPLLRWTIIPGAAGYQVGFSSRPFYNAVDEWHEVNDTEWRVPGAIWNQLPEGELYWTVRPVETSGQTREPALMRHIWRVPDGALSPTSTVPSLTATQKLLLAWQPIKGQVVYRVSVSSDPEGKEIVRRFVGLEPRAELRDIEGLLKRGQTYYWSVEAYSSGGRLVIAGSRQSFIAHTSARDETPVRRVKYEAATLRLSSLQGLDGRIVSRSPGPDRTVLDARPTVAIEFNTGVTPSEMVLVVDDTDVTAMVEVAGSSIRFKPVIPLSDGEHQVTLRMGADVDKWKFVVNQVAEVEANASIPGTQAEAEHSSAAPEQTAAASAATESDASAGSGFNATIGSNTQWVSGSEGDTNTLSLGSQMNVRVGLWRTEFNGSGLLNSLLTPGSTHALGRFKDYVFRLAYDTKGWGGDLRFGIISPGLYRESEFVTTAFPREGIESTFHTPLGAFSFCANVNDLAPGGGAGTVFHQQIRGASYEAPLPRERFTFRLMSLNVRDVGPPAGISLDEATDPRSISASLAAKGAGDAYGGLLVVHLGTWQWTSEYASSSNNPDTLLATSKRLSGRAWRTSATGKMANTTLSAAYRDVSPDYATPANPSLTLFGASGRRGLDLSASRLTKIGAMAVTYQYLQSDLNERDRPSNSLHNLTWNWSRNLGETTAITVGGARTRAVPGELPQAVAALTKEQRLALTTDQRGVGFNTSVTQKAGMLTVTFAGSRDWVHNRAVDKQNAITSSVKVDTGWKAASVLQIRANSSVNWVAGDPSGVGTTRIINTYIQPMLVWQRTQLSLAPLFAITRTTTSLRGNLLTQNTRAGQYGGRLSWQMPGRLRLSTLALEGGWSQTRNQLLGAGTAMPRLLVLWTVTKAAKWQPRPL